MNLPPDLLAARTPTRANGLAGAPDAPDLAAIWARVRPRIDFERWNRAHLEQRHPPALVEGLAVAAKTNVAPRDPSVLGLLGRLTRNAEIDTLALAVGGVDLAFDYFVAYSAQRPEFHPFLPPLSDTVRKAVLVLDPTPYEAARARAVDIARGAELEAAVAIADCFPDEQAFVASVAERAIRATLSPLPARVVAMLRDPTLVLRALQRWNKSALPQILPFAVDLVEGLGVGAAEPIALGLRERKSDKIPGLELAVRALATLDDEVVGTILVPLLESKLLAPIVTAWIERVGARAERALRAVAKGELVGRKGSGTRAVTAARARLAGSAPSTPTPHEATAAAVASPTLPAVLAAPPWLQKKKAKPETLERALLSFAETAPDRAPRRPRRGNADADARARDELSAARDGTKQAYVSAFGGLDDDEALALWNESNADWFHGGDYDGRSVAELIERLGIAALPGLLAYAEGKLPSAVPALVSVVSPRVAPHVALVFATGKKREAAEKWLLDHPEAASLGLVPAALSADRKKRDAARTALRYLVDCGAEAIVTDVARRYDVEGPIARALRDDLPSRIPTGALFVEIADLPAPRLADGTPLSAAACEHLVTMLRFSPVVPAYSGLRDVRAACERASLSAFVLALLDRWIARGTAPSDEWVLWAVGHLGDDEAVKRLVREAASWQVTGASQRAAKAMDAIALIGSDWAFFELDRVARTARKPLLRDAASAAVERVARRLRLHPDELEDRRAPTLGLDARGGLDLDFGERKLRATLDEHLVPYLVDADGARVAKAPKGGDGGARFKELTKNAALVAESQIERFERAMTTERTWTKDAFCTYVAAHPLLAHLAKRLVWSVGDATKATRYRMAEDGTLADLADERIELSAHDGDVRIAHPLRMNDGERKKWAERLTDYLVIQPFAQLGRETFALDAKDREGTSLVSLAGRSVPWDRVAKLLRHGFRDASMDGVIHTIARKLPFGVEVSLGLQPGLSRVNVATSGEQRIERATVRGVNRLAELSPVAASELLRVLSPLTERSTE